MGAVPAGANKKLYVRGRVAVALSVLGGAAAAAGYFLIAIGLKAVGGPVFVVGLGMVLGSVTFLGAFEQLALLRLIQDLPTARIRSAHQGYVELQGFVHTHDKLISCTECGEPCLWFQYHKRKKGMFTPKGRTPTIVLDDETGQCVVQVAGAELAAPGGSKGHIHIKPGDWIYALGEFRSRSSASPAAPSPEQKAALRGRLEALKRDPKRMALFDRNQDGAVDSREWEAAVKATELQVAREPARNPEASLPEHVLGAPTTDRDRLPFVIFVGTEEEAIRRARMAVVLLLLYAVAAGIFVFAWAVGVMDSKL